MVTDPSPLDDRIASLDRRIEQLSRHLPAPAPRHRPPPPADPLEGERRSLMLAVSGNVFILVGSVLMLLFVGPDSEAIAPVVILGSLVCLAINFSGLRDLDRARMMRQANQPATV